MLFLIENHQVGEKKEGEGDEGVVVQVGPQEGKAPHLFFLTQNFGGGQPISFIDMLTRKRRVAIRKGS